MRLKELRKKAGLSQAQLAKEFNVAQNTISQWELGLRSLDVDTVSKLADFFGVSIDYLLGRDETASQTQHVDDDEALEYLDELHKRPEMKTLFQVTRRATKDDIQTAITIIEALKKKEQPED